MFDYYERKAMDIDDEETEERYCNTSGEGDNGILYDNKI